MWACAPVEHGRVPLDGVQVHYEVFGDGPDTILLLPPWAINHSRFWKAQVPFLARHFRVVTFDPRGNGRSDRPADAAAYAEAVVAEHTVALMDATDTERALLVVHCGSAGKGLLLCAEHPARVAGAVFMSPALPLTPPRPERTGHPFDEPLESDEGWAKLNRHYWERDYRGFLEFFFRRCFPEPHSSKPIEDGVAWALETTPETLALTLRAPGLDAATARALMERVRCPVLVIQGEEDLLVPGDRGAAFAAGVGGRLATLEGSGHCPHARDPVRFNGLVRDFADEVFGRREPVRWRRAQTRRRRALFVSSPIGLGHVWRDVAIAAELRGLRPELEIDWLAQEPVTSVLRACGERIHPASERLASEAAHIQRHSGEHTLQVFEAWRAMDAILIANFMVFADLVRCEPYDVWIGDEAWEIDHHLHENPELKSAAYCWLTDFVGWLPMAGGGEREARLTADYNAEMIDQVERFPRVRDRALFVGDPEDVVDAGFGPGLPAIADWTARHFEFTGQIGPTAPADRAALRAELGYREDEVVCLAAVGGSGIGADLLRRVIEAAGPARELVPGLRTVVVSGPRIDPARLPQADGVEVRPYVHRLDRHLAACDVAVVQGGLSTAVELVAAARPFVCVPLRGHFEQQFHVRHRLERHGAGRYLDYDAATPETLAAEMAVALRSPPPQAPVMDGGAARAAGLIAELL